MYKKDIINFLFIISFPVYGIGLYVAAAKSPSVGSVLSALPHILILLFYLIDICYKRDFQIRINGYYWVMLVFIFSTILSLFMALYKGLPLVNTKVVIGKSLLMFLPFHSFIVVFLYNRHQKKDPVPNMTFISMSLLVFVNLVGYYVFGQTNEGHMIDDRVNLPYFAGLYEGASVLAVVSLMMMWKVGQGVTSLPLLLWRIFFISLNLYVLFLINSRLTMMAMVLVIGLAIFKGIKSKAVYWVSLFTLPILLSSGIILYKIMSHPLIASVMVRSDYRDITTFNGRSLMWERAFEWLVYDRRGLLIGNGYEGQYFIGLLRDIEKIWHPTDTLILHFHSASLEILVNQGLLGLIPILILAYRIFIHYRKKYLEDDAQGMFYLIVVFILFDLQFNTYIYFQCTGTALIALMIARISLKDDMPDDKQESSALKEPKQEERYLVPQ